MTRMKTLVLVSCSAALISVALAEAARNRTPSPAARANREVAEKLKELGMDPEMILRCKMLMNADVGRSNPSSLLVVRDDLKLSKEQVQKLKDLVEATRTKARAILTEEQLKKVDALPVQPFSGMTMHLKMAGLMKAKDVAMHCPMLEVANAMTKPAPIEKEKK